MRYSVLIITIVILFLSCESEEKTDPYAIGSKNIGLLTDSTQVRELEEIFAEDSIVKRVDGDEFMGNTNDIEIFSKEGKKLLTLSPVQVLDSTSNISSVQIHNEQFKTEKEISTLSTFKDIKDNYTISSINNLIGSIIVSVDDINAAFTIDKDELPANLRYDMDMKIEKAQIPDSAKIKYFMLHWN